MALAMLARAFSLRRANQRAKALRLSVSSADGMSATSAEQSAIHSSRVSQSIDALYVLSCLREGISLVDAFVSDSDNECATVSNCCGLSERDGLSSLSPSEIARSSDAWDRDIASMSSCCGSDHGADKQPAHMNKLNHDAPASLRVNSSICTDFKMDALAEDQGAAADRHLISSPSPPPAHCCFVIRRKSNFSEDEVKDLCGGDQINSSGLSNITANGQKSSRKSRMNQQKDEGDADEDDATADPDVVIQGLLKEGGMVAVQKQSRNPYLDFRESMRQTVTREVSDTFQSCDFTKLWRSDDQHSDMLVNAAAKNIEDLLYCYLRLNPMDLHELIIQAFSDACSELLQVDSNIDFVRMSHS